MRNVGAFPLGVLGFPLGVCEVWFDGGEALGVCEVWFGGIEALDGSFLWLGGLIGKVGGSMGWCVKAGGSMGAESWAISKRRSRRNAAIARAVPLAVHPSQGHCQKLGVWGFVEVCVFE